MRKKFIAGNWKMNKTYAEAGKLAGEIVSLAKGASCDVCVCVPYIDIPAVSDALRGSPVLLGAQNCHFKESGAYTGEISPSMLNSVGVKAVIIGHSERRQYFGETDESVNMKTKAALAAGLLSIVCVGETLSQREQGYTNALVSYQTKIALFGISEEDVRKTVIAYEPIWAIGTGKTATDAEANETIGVIRNALRELYNGAADDIRILYGGSMNENNAASLLAQNEIDGGLIGGASLAAEKFAAIVKAAR